MLLATGRIRQFLEDKGFTRDDSEPFACAAGYEDNGRFLVMDESYTWQDVEMLIQDCEAVGADAMAVALRELL